MRRVTQRLCAVITSILATVAVTAASAVIAPVSARADDGFEWTFTVATPDSEYGMALCTTSTSLQFGTSGRPTLVEQAAGSVSSSGCGPVVWAASIIIHDMSLPWYPNYVDGNGGTDGNPARAEVSQEVEYGMGVREVGVIQVNFEAVSRLGTVCYHLVATFDVVDWTSKVVLPVPCAW